MSPDPLAVHVPGEADWNLYAYVTGQALKSVDPVGLEDAAAEDMANPGPYADSGQYRSNNGDGNLDYSRGRAATPDGTKAPSRANPAPAGGGDLTPDPNDPFDGSNLTGASAGEGTGSSPVMEAALTAAAVLNQETPDAIKTDGSGEHETGVPGGQCTGSRCIRSRWSQVAYLFSTLVGVAIGGVAGKADDVVKAGKRLVEAAGERIADAGKAIRKAARGVPNPGGRLGKPGTRQHIDDVATEMEQRGWEITGGGNRLPEEYLPGPGGGRRGSSFPDITATKNGRTLRVNTVDTLKDGVTPTAREARNAARIRGQTPGDHLLLIPKPK